MIPGARARMPPRPKAFDRNARRPLGPKLAPRTLWKVTRCQASHAFACPPGAMLDSSHTHSYCVRLIVENHIISDLVVATLGGLVAIALATILQGRGKHDSQRRGPDASPPRVQRDGDVQSKPGPLPVVDANDADEIRESLEHPGALTKTRLSNTAAGIEPDERSAVLSAPSIPSDDA
jgi:hypothetical protein